MKEVHVRQYGRRRDVVPQIGDVVREFEAAHKHVPDEEFNPNLDALFEHYSNLYGRLSSELRDRLRMVVAYPNDATWEDAHSILLRWESIEGRERGPTTLWKAVLAVDPSFLREGPIYREGGRAKTWSRVPDQQTLLRALWWAAAAPAVRRSK